MDFGYYDEIQRLKGQGKIVPKAGETYTYEEIAKKLALADSPHLGFTQDRVRGVIQNSHLTRDQMLTVPGMAESRWMYVHTTREWIPVFRYTGSCIGALVDMVRVRDIDERTSWWATPKGFPRSEDSYGRIQGR